MAAPGQTINDRLNAVRYALAGQGLARTVCKATTLEVLGPKKKHIDYLLACTNEPNVSTPQLANLLIERTQHTNWAVVFKSLISIHHLMSEGNERFTQYLATSNHSFELGDFMDRTTPQGYNMSSFVRRYAKYINDKSISYRTLAIDLCKIRRGNDNALRTMNMDNLSKTLPIVQAQFDSLLEFGAEVKDLNNGIIMAAFRLLYRDLCRLYVAYQEAIINLLERYFKLSRKKTREALELYKKYLARMDKVAGFLQVVEAVELDKSEMPDLTKSPASILKVLEQHLADLEAKKRGATPVSPDQPEEDDAEVSGETSSKENEPPIKAAEDKNDEPEVAKKVEQQQKSSNQSEQKPAAEPEKPAPPQKPARPSPKASPKVSPASRKPTAATSSSSSPAPPPPPPPPPAPTTIEKKGPPERPAKPPSRPPPPSSSSAAPPSAASSSSSSTPTTSAPDQPVAGRAEEPSSAQAKVASPTPPPHPPPPHVTAPAPAAATAAATAVAPAAHVPAPTPEPEQETAIEQSASSAPAAAVPESNEVSTDGVETNGQTTVEPVAPDNSAPSCSAILSSEAAVQESNELGGETNHNLDGNEQVTNHVNNGTTALEEEEIIPPPPIDDNEFDNIPQEPPVEVAAEVNDAPQEPVVNGE